MLKIPCQICNLEGTLQKVGNNYYRIRHYTGVNKTTRKPRFHYHQNTKHYAEVELEKLRGTKTLENTIFDQTKNGQQVNIDPKQKNLSLEVEMAGPLGFEPRTFSLEG